MRLLSPFSCLQPKHRMLCGVGTANQRLVRLIEDAIPLSGAPVNLFKEVKRRLRFPSFLPTIPAQPRLERLLIEKLRHPLAPPTLRILRGCRRCKSAQHRL